MKKICKRGLKKLLLCPLLILLLVLLGCQVEPYDRGLYNYETSDINFISQKKEIKSLNHEKEGEFSGMFFIGTGAIRGRGNAYYYVYTKERNDKYLLEKFDSTKTYIAETNDVTPNLEERSPFIVVGPEILNDNNKFKVDGIEHELFIFDGDTYLRRPLTKYSFITGTYESSYYLVVDIETLNELTKDELLANYPMLRFEKYILISTKVDERTLYVPEGTIIEEYSTNF